MFTAMMSGRPYPSLKHLIALRTISADAVRTSSGVFAALTLRAALHNVRYFATLRSYGATTSRSRTLNF